MGPARFVTADLCSFTIDGRIDPEEGLEEGPNEFVPTRNIAQCALIYALTAAEALNRDA